MTEETENITTVQVEGMTHELDNGGSVFVGQCLGEDSVYIRFWNGELETKLRLSFEAAKELRTLLEAISSRGIMAESTWVLATEEKPQPSDAALAT
jgi:hypothetical protein